MPEIRSPEALIEAFDQPAYLVDERGTVLFANDAARRRFASTPAWVRSLAMGETDAAIPEGAKHSPIVGSRGTLHVVVAPKNAPVPKAEAFDWSGYGLGETLAEIASLVASGLADKDIAERTGRPLATVRTYVSRVLAKVGVNRRAQLAVLVYGTAREDGAADDGDP